MPEEEEDQNPASFDPTIARVDDFQITENYLTAERLGLWIESDDEDEEDGEDDDIE
ncbi:MAG: hypothetical protein ACOC9Y_07985 [Chloroflexota bacterium]